MRFFAALLAAGLSLSPATAALASEPEILAYDPVGTEVQGAPDVRFAPTLDPGISLDRFGGIYEKSHLFYKLPKIQEGERLHVSAQLIVDPLRQPGSRESIQLAGSLLWADGSCASDVASTNRSDIASLPLITFISEPKGSPGYTRCTDTENNEPSLALHREGLWQDDAEIPVQIRVVVQPAMNASTTAQSAADAQPPVSVAPDTSASAVSGGSGFSNATALEPGSVYSDAVLPLEVKYYKVHVAEGQRLGYRMSVLDSPEASASRLHTSTYSPLLQDGLMTSGAKRSLIGDAAGASLSRSLASPVSRARQAAGPHPELSFPGYYYITVTGSAEDPKGQIPLAYELGVELSGEAAGEDVWEPAFEVSAPGSRRWPLGALAGGAAAALAGLAALRFRLRR
ncbi:hypothetical protein ACT3UA_17555 [Glutamicibacter sp. 363]|uniref:hypothetical protein n=1 Tax=unclassified Glutamicibacter TaxID=2627139 RepID=UPI0040343B44